MQEQLYITGSVIAVSLFYGTSPTFKCILTAFNVGLLTLPVLAIITIVDPSQKVLVPSNAPHTWYPQGKGMAHTILLIAFGFIISRDMDIAADVHAGLAKDFDIYLAVETGAALLWTIFMSFAAFFSLAVGKGLSMSLEPVFQRFGLLRWDAGPIERSGQAGHRLHEWSLRPEREGIR